MNLKMILSRFLPRVLFHQLREVPSALFRDNSPGLCSLLYLITNTKHLSSDILGNLSLKQILKLGNYGNCRKRTNYT